MQRFRTHEAPTIHDDELHTGETRRRNAPPETHRQVTDTLVMEATMRARSAGEACSAS